MMIRFLYNSDRSANEERWLITGLAVRIAQMVGSTNSMRFFELIYLPKIGLRRHFI